MRPPPTVRHEAQFLAPRIIKGGWVSYKAVIAEFGQDFASAIISANLVFLRQPGEPALQPDLPESAATNPDQILTFFSPAHASVAKKMYVH